MMYRCHPNIQTVRWIGSKVPDEIAFPLIMERLKGRRRITASGCWEYTGYILPNGYAEICFRGRNTRITRLVHRIYHGPTDLDVLHSCDNTICFNPEHLSAGTDKQNIGESIARGRRNTARKPYGKGHPMPAERTHCIHGHAFDDKNTYRTPDGRRQCRACHHKAVTRWGSKP
jgi:hypothetical protein